MTASQPSSPGWSASSSTSPPGSGVTPRTGCARCETAARGAVLAARRHLHCLPQRGPPGAGGLVGTLRPSPPGHPRRRRGGRRVAALHGSKRHHTLSVLRSLFRHCKKTGAVFRDPAARVRVGRQPYGLLLPLRPEEIGEATTAAATAAATPAARPKAIRQLQLSDVDLGNRQLVVAGRVRPLDDLTRQVLLAWLAYRRRRWPNTANPHLILSQQSAMETGPVSRPWMTEAFRGLDATLERLRVDRQLDEALTRGADPLHLTAVFGLDEKTAIRYAHAARQLLISAAEQDTASGSPRTQGPELPMESENP